MKKLMVEIWVPKGTEILLVREIDECTKKLFEFIDEKNFGSRKEQSKIVYQDLDAQVLYRIWEFCLNKPYVIESRLVAEEDNI